MGIQIGTIIIPWYGLFIVLGVLGGACMGYILMRMKKMSFDDFIQTACFTGLGAMLGAKLLYLALSWKDIDFSRLTDMDYLNSLMGGGFVFYGGVAGGIAGLWICGKILHIQVWEYACAAIPVIPLAHAFGRMGCLFAGCCYGVSYDGLGAIVYTESLFAPLHTPLFPVQAVEAGIEILIAVVLFVYVWRAEKCRIHSVELYLILYAPVRFALEFFRNDAERGGFLGMSTSQWISILVIVGEICLIIRRRKRNHTDLCVVK